MNKRIISMLLMAVLIALSLYFNAGEQQEKKQAEKPASTSEQAIQNQHVQQIDELTKQANVVGYMQKHHQLPRFYVTKKEARRAGWNPKQGNLCDVLPGKAIGGDRFSNREQRLPIAPNRQWYEADLNYNCGHRGADRLLYSSDGMIYVTRDHYKSFQEIN
ncbi:ribonuclease domain-containing protein [Providencia vermicola]|uniref:Ribonuclease n=2 Tax=Providencia TaxID=586 RepID=A0ABD5L617_PROST|nr:MULTISPECIES: ribonuclease domain-containing protein [Providencia]ELR5043702.1 ribonuclease [Providencia rettgeri]ELR5121156.1 ribonuclease [Providencia stuartii]ELR5142216.1 ribonuclease [Providencia stuartii]ELR5291441.1 ribonuclease [Providencia stuartii]ELX8377770.1 ribonuclease [Providencia stuartii]